MRVLELEDETTPLAMMEADGLLRREGDRFRTTRRWQSAMARAAFRLVGAGVDGDDLRVPVAAALLEIYGVDEAEEYLADLVEAMLPIEARELAPIREST
jgi:hypothetical protein